MELKRLATVVVVVLGVVFVVRAGVSLLHWYGCNQNGPAAVLLTVDHLGAPPSVTECAAYALARPTPTTVDLPCDEPGECGTEPERATTQATTLWGDPAGSWPYPTSTGPDYGKVSCAEGGCEVSGPCPDNVPPVSHFTCTGEP